MRNARLVLYLDGVAYRAAVNVDSTTPDVVAVIRLERSDGSHYNVTADGDGVACDCADFEFRRRHLDPRGCKHVQGLAATGLLAMVATRPCLA